MRYFKIIEGARIGRVLCTFLRSNGIGTWHEVIHRADSSIDDAKYKPGFACYHSAQVPPARRHGKMIEISEQEVMQLDPSFLKEAFADYEEYKAWEAEKVPSSSKKSKTNVKQHTLL